MFEGEVGEEYLQRSRFEITSLQANITNLIIQNKELQYQLYREKQFNEQFQFRGFQGTLLDKDIKDFQDTRHNLIKNLSKIKVNSDDHQNNKTNQDVQHQCYIQKKKLQLINQKLQKKVQSYELNNDQIIGQL